MGGTQIKNKLQFFRIMVRLKSTLMFFKRLPRLRKWRGTLFLRSNRHNFRLRGRMEVWDMMVAIYGYKRHFWRELPTSVARNNICCFFKKLPKNDLFLTIRCDIDIYPEIILVKTGLFRHQNFVTRHFYDPIGLFDRHVYTMSRLTL